MHASDRPIWGWLSKSLKRLGIVALYAFVLAAGMGLHEPRRVILPWQIMVAAFFLMVAAQFLHQRIALSTAHPSASLVLLNLPLKGEFICRWVRICALLEFAPILLLLGITAASCLAGFSVPSTEVLVQGTSLALITAITALLLTDPLLHLLRLPQLWSVIKGICVLIAGWSILIDRWDSAPPPWVLSFCQTASWLLPPAWVVYAADEPLAGALLIGWFAWGACWWWRWPRVCGALLDQPADLLPTYLDAEIDEEAENAPAEIPTAGDEATAGNQLTAGPVVDWSEEKPIPLPADGWIERLAFTRLNQKDAAIASALVDPIPGWTKRWMTAVKISALICMAAGVLSRWTPFYKAYPSFEAWTWVASAGSLIVLTFPFLNMLPRAAIAWPLGQQAFPFFAGLPVRLRGMLRISTRVTLARAIAFLVIALPMFVVLAQLLPKGAQPWLGVKLISALMVCWCLSRPVFLYYRLQEQSTPRWRFRAGHYAALILIVALGMIWISSGIAVSGTSAVIFGPVDTGYSWVWLAISIIVHGVSARAIFELYLWRLRQGKIDAVFKP